MKKVLVCCNAGVSTSLLVAKLERAAEARGAGYSIEAHPLAEAIDHLSSSDVVLLAPQVGFAEANLREATTAPVRVIDVEAYARANAEQILDDIADLLG